MLLLRLWDLQVLNAPKYEKTVAAEQVRTVTIDPVRGDILARNGQILAGNTTTEEITLSRAAAASDPGVISRLATLLSMPVSQIKAAINDSSYSNYRPVPIMQQAPLADVLYIREHALEFPGVKAQLATVRDYPQGDLAAQLVGYLSEISPKQLKALSSQGYQAGDLIGQSGMEAGFQQWLRGVPGSENLEVDAQGNVVGVASKVPAKPGDEVVSTIDLSLQRTLQTDLAAEIHALRGTVPLGQLGVATAPGGAGVVIDPNNGHVLAMASYPSYNPNWWVGGMSYAHYAELTNPSAHDPLLNRAIAGEYTPGSTFKIATATAALDTGLVTPSTIINDPGYFQIPNCNSAAGRCRFHNAGYESLGPINIVTGLAASDDVFFYTLGFRFWINRAKYGETPIQDYAEKYGFGEPTGIDIPGSSIGQVDTPQLRALQHKEDPAAFPDGGWYVGDNLEMAFGQGETLVTPIQLADAYATFANGGTRYAPQLALAAETPSGKVVKVFKPKIEGHVNLPSTTRQTMLAGFEGAVDNPIGTAGYTFAGYPFSKFPIAGKTGTASVKGELPTSLFVAFGPVGAPRYVVAVVISQAGYGATGAAPVARKIFEYLMNHPVPSPKLPLPPPSG